jgi:hypothetical protein
VKIVSDDDVDAAAFAILKSEGYEFRRELHPETEVEYDVAESKGDQFWGLSPAEVLGLVTLFSARGEHWKPSNDENKSFSTFNKASQREADTSLAKETVVQIAKPKNLSALVGLALASGLKTFSMICLTAFYLRDFFVVQRPLSWIILPLALFGLWSTFGRLENFFGSRFKLQLKYFQDDVS